jgi:hypothetical protein
LSTIESADKIYEIKNNEVNEVPFESLKREDSDLKHQKDSFNKVPLSEDSQEVKDLSLSSSQKNKIPSTLETASFLMKYTKPTSQLVVILVMVVISAVSNTVYAIPEVRLYLGFAEYEDHDQLKTKLNYTLPTLTALSIICFFALGWFIAALNMICTRMIYLLRVSSYN